MKARSIAGHDPLTGRPIHLTVEGGRIRSIEEVSSAPDRWLSPGFIDLQINGYGGSDLNDDYVDADVVVSLAHKVLATGTTTFLPTIITASEEKIVRATAAIAKARRVDPLVASIIPFVHVEGPHISPEDGPRGAHPREHVRPPDVAGFDRWQHASQNLVGLVTISPHWQNAPEYIAALAARGVLLALGHSSAEPDRIRAAVDAGAKLSTHLGNGVARLLPRHPNLLWTQLAEDRLTATFIADGHHLPADTLRAMLRAKGIERSILVSDSVALAGMPPGIYASPIGDRVELHSDGRLNMLGTEFLAGAACSLSHAVARLLDSSICAPEDVFRMVTENPGRFVGGRGKFRPGARADFIAFTLNPEKQSLTIEMMLIEGIEHEPAP